MATLGLPKNIEALANEGSVKLFGKWETADVDVGGRMLQGCRTKNDALLIISTTVLIRSRISP